MSRQFSKEVERTAFFRAKGRCEGCDTRLAAGAICYDHMVPWAMSCDSSLINCQVLCKTCHDIKTARQDVPNIAKAKRQSDFHQGIAGPGLGRAPMAGGRLSRLKKTFRHGIVPRQNQVELYRALMRDRFSGWKP
jgi:hypothetical protein